MVRRSLSAMNSAWAFSAVLACALMCGSCANVRVRKVPTPTQYIEWTDEMQHEADEMEGVRFYLPRPFLNVFESFPVKTDIYIADGYVAPGKDYIVITDIRGSGELATAFGSVKNKRLTIARRSVFRPGADVASALGEGTANAIEAQSASEGDDETSGAAEELVGANKKVSLGNAKGEGSEAGGGTETGNGTGAEGNKEKSGVSKGSVTNDNAAFAYVPLRGNFDVIYMPDFEEQFAVSSSAGLGNAEFQVNMGQGWSLQGFDFLVDNSRLVDRLFTLIDTAVDTAKNVIPGLPALAGLPGATNMIAPQSAEESADGEPWTACSLKISVVHYAAKGLYPVIKPRELQLRAIDLDDTSSYAIDLFTNTSTARPVATIGGRELARNIAAVDNTSGAYTVPRYPYQYVSFNTFRYVAVEVVSGTGSPSTGLYDDTGTTGDSGDEQKADLSEFIRDMLSNMTRGPGDKSENGESKKAELDQLNNRDDEPNADTQLVVALADAVKKFNERVASATTEEAPNPFDGAENKPKLAKLTPTVSTDKKKVTLTPTISEPDLEHEDIRDDADWKKRLEDMILVFAEPAVKAVYAEAEVVVEPAQNTP